jgi:pyrimidine operon attenuation protein / uracil phosphoribosyltransferase
MSKTLILTALQIEQRITRIAWQIYEDNPKEKNIIIAGIAKSGFILAQRIADKIKEISPIRTNLIKVNLDKENPLSGKAEIEGEIEKFDDEVVILVDDVLNSGKTLMYGMKPFLEAKVRKIRTAVLVDRNHNRFPVATDFTGISLSTTLQEHISVEIDKAKKEGVYLS